MFTQAELSLLRQSLDVITITGKDAKYVASIQEKIDSLIAESQPKNSSKKS